MSDYFESDIDKLDEEDVSALEDNDELDTIEADAADFVYPRRLFRLKLE